MRSCKELESEAGHAVAKRIRSMAMSQRVNTQAIAQKFALTQVVSRLFSSDYAELFVLKGGMLAMKIEDVDPITARMTDDIDLQAPAFHGTIRDFEAVVRDVLGKPPTVDDGLRFDLRPGAIASSARTEEGVPGGSLRIGAQIGGLGLTFKVDVTFDSRPIFDVAVETKLPSVLGDGYPPVSVRRIPFSWVLADKLQAQVRHGDRTTRLRDFYDIWLIVDRDIYDPEETVRGLRMTFDLFKGEVPSDVADIAALSDAYATRNAGAWEKEKTSRRFAVDVPDLPTIARAIREKVGPLFEQAAAMQAAPAGHYLKRDGVAEAMRDRISGLGS